MTKEEERKINLICRMAGNILVSDEVKHVQTAINLAVDIYHKVEKVVIDGNKEQ